MKPEKGEKGRTQNLLRDAVQLLAREDPQEGPGEIETLKNGPVGVHSLVDVFLLELVQEQESELHCSRASACWNRPVRIPHRK